MSCTLVPALAHLGIEVHVVTPQRRGGPAYEATAGGAHIHRVEPPAIADPDMVQETQQTNMMLAQAALALAAQTGAFDLIHAHDWQVASAGLTLKHAWHVPLIATMHATERGRGQGYIWTQQSEQINQIEWQLTYEAWRIIVCSHFMAEQLQHYFNTPFDKKDVVPNGVTVQPSPFVSEAERAAFRSIYATPESLLVFNVGRVVFEKGVHVLIEAWPGVLAQQPGARLVIAGTGGQLDRLKARAWELGIGQDVIFHGLHHGCATRSAVCQCRHGSVSVAVRAVWYCSAGSDGRVLPGDRVADWRFDGSRADAPHWFNCTAE